MNFVTCGQMKILERRANRSGLSYYIMMENAGIAAAGVIADKSKLPISDSKAVLFCGKGNNGGDGFVVARELLRQGCDVVVVLVDGKPVADDAATNFSLLEGQVPFVDMTQDSNALLEIKIQPDFIVDAIYGTGFYGMLNANALKSAAFINHFSDKALVFSLDIPSGLGGDVLSISRIDSSAVRAQYTIAFHKRKPVHIQAFSKDFCGETIVVDIGIDEDALW